MRSPTTFHSGFTTIELLVAMTIITIIGGVATPMLQRSAKQAALNEAVELVGQAHRVALDAAQFRALRKLGASSWQPIMVHLDITGHGVRVHAVAGTAYATPLPYGDGEGASGGNLIFSADFPAGATAWAVDALGKKVEHTVSVYYCVDIPGQAIGPGNGFCDGDAGPDLSADPTPVRVLVGLGGNDLVRTISIHHNGRLTLDEAR